MESAIHPPRHLIWSINTVNLNDPFQKRWYLRQILTHGTADDIRNVDWDEVAQEIEELNLPENIARLWRSVLLQGNER